MGVAERYLYVALARHFRSVGDAGADVGLVEARVVAQDFFAARPAREQVENQRHPDPVPPDARLSEAHLGVDRYAGKQLFSSHDDTITVSLDPLPGSVRREGGGVGGREAGISRKRDGREPPESAVRVPWLSRSIDVIEPPSDFLGDLRIDDTHRATEAAPRAECLFPPEATSEPPPRA